MNSRERLKALGPRLAAQLAVLGMATVDPFVWEDVSVDDFDALLRPLAENARESSATHEGAATLSLLFGATRRMGVPLSQSIVEAMVQAADNKEQNAHAAIEVEESVVAAILKTGTIPETVSPELFVDPFCRAAVEAQMQAELVGNNGEYLAEDVFSQNLLRVYTEMRRKGGYGAEAMRRLVQINERLPGLEFADYWIDKLKQSRARHDAMQIADRLAISAANPYATLDDLRELFDDLKELFEPSNAENRSNPV